MSETDTKDFHFSEFFLGIILATFLVSLLFVCVGDGTSYSVYLNVTRPDGIKADWAGTVLATNRDEAIGKATHLMHSNEADAGDVVNYASVF